MLIWIIGFIIVLVIMKMSPSKKEEVSQSPTAVKKRHLHKWEYLKDEEGNDADMYCTECKKTPSQILNEHGLGQ